jgi:hypothetical protein
MFQEMYQRFADTGKSWMPRKKSLPGSILVLFLSFSFSFVSTPAAAKSPATGKCVAVSGKVTITGQDGKTSRMAKKGTKVAEGESIVTSEDASAVLVFSDGSQLTLQPGTELSMVELKKSPDEGVALRFKLALGSLLAEVARMLSVNSRFEIEAGGVVCGVRGTKFTLQYDPGPKKLFLKVSQGSVYADSGDKRRLVNAGGQIEFLKGKPVGEGPSTGPAEDDAAKSRPPGYADPALKDLHEQFSGENRSYRNRALNDPAAAGRKIQTNPNSGTGVIEAKP